MNYPLIDTIKPFEDGSVSAEIGSSIALTPDETLMVVGAIQTYDRRGRPKDQVHTFKLVAGAWVLNDTLIAPHGTGDNPFLFGYSVALSDDGLVLAVGTTEYESMSWSVSWSAGDFYQTGAVYIFDRVNDVWVQRGKQIENPNNSWGDLFGSFVGFNDSGNVLIVGDNTTKGGRNQNWFIFEYDGSDWIEKDDIVFSSGIYQDPNQIYARDASMIDNTLYVLVSADFDGQNHKLRLDEYDVSNNQFSFIKEIFIKDSSGLLNASKNSKVSIKPDKFIIGHPDYDDTEATNIGNVEIYDFDGNNVTINDNLFAEIPLKDSYFGKSVFITPSSKLYIADEEYLGIDSRDTIGTIYIYDVSDRPLYINNTKKTRNWTKKGEILEKYEHERLLFDIDLSDKMSDGEEHTTVKIFTDTTNGITVNDYTHSAFKVQLDISGGNQTSSKDYIDYQITIESTTSYDQILERSVTLRILKNAHN